MPATPDALPAPRIPLSRDRVLRAAVTFADENGIETLSMRKLGQVVGVEAMSLYNRAARQGLTVQPLTLRPHPARLAASCLP